MLRPGQQVEHRLHMRRPYLETISTFRLYIQNDRMLGLLQRVTILPSAPKLRRDFYLFDHVTHLSEKLRFQKKKKKS